MVKNPCKNCPFAEKRGRDYYCNVIPSEIEQNYGNIKIRGEFRPARYVKHTAYCVADVL